MTESDYILPMEQTKRIFFVIYNGFEILDLSGPASVFSAANQESGGDHYQVVVLSPKGGEVAAGAGPVVLSQALDTVTFNSTDTLLVVGAEKQALDLVVENRRLIDWLLQAAVVVSRLGSFCLGSFILAEAGLLNRKSAATHWAACRWLVSAYPSVSVHNEALYVKDKRLWTSAGVTTGIDMALAMVEEDLGRRLMGAVARRMVVYAHRSGDQPQKSPLLEAQVEAGDALAEVIVWMEANMHRRIKVTDMAERAYMSERHFYRQFTRRFDQSPNKFLEGLRLERAKHFLASGMPIKAAAPAVGFHSEAAFRTAFKNRHGLSPTAYQKRHQHKL